MGEQAGGAPEDEVRETARKFALQNAVQHGGSCEMGPVMARVLGERAEWRSSAKVVSAVVKDVIAEVNAMAPEA
nr:hypothetical protein [Thermoplasmata archaeon]NIS13499.1 hypothetical protein [Thermoplasmata archaeon]NIS21373.1 hypothetical protein [Thermoplasmata archaeon]NIT78922.1 hypothetical protein [Thermoplasmata archaeon]NIU50426.1 hypothetical protein [Thermoplasmata archaeon]